MGEIFEAISDTESACLHMSTSDEGATWASVSEIGFEIHLLYNQ